MSLDLKMYQKLIYLIVCFLQLIVCNEIFPRKENIHNFMDQEELSYYFGSDSKQKIPEYEIVEIPLSTWNIKDAGPDHNDLNFEFNAFSKPISLRMRRNAKLISPSLRIVKRTEDGGEEDLSGNKIENCHYLHSDEMTVAALSSCHGNEVNGIILLSNSTLEIQPLSKRLQSILNMREALSEDDIFGEEAITKIPHIIKRASFNGFLADDPIRKNFVIKRQLRPIGIDEETTIDDNFLDHERKKRGTRDSKITVEVGVFFDEAAYKIFAPHFGYDDHKIRDLLLAYMNGVQALYHHSSLGRPIDITIVYMEIMERQPRDMVHHNGERGQLLDSFCDYQKTHNPGDDTNPQHWDMGLYISGLDFYAIENGKKSGVTMGLATVGGVCIDQYQCIIAEFGTTNVFGKPYPSAGFTSVFILAHEIGHNLGMHHDSSGNSCPKDGYVMSPSRGTQGETIWSSCSADVASNLEWAKCLFDRPKSTPTNLNAWKFNGNPGLTYTAKDQCEILLRDSDAVPSTTSNLDQICQNLMCRTPHRTGMYFSGPALEGTNCGWNKHCIGGSCSSQQISSTPIKVVEGGWSDWKTEKCKSDCILKSKGFQKRRRNCDNPRPVNTAEGCEGNSFDVVLCKDNSFCRRKKRQDVVDYASQKCKEFSEELPALDPEGKGLQAPHETQRLWMGCAIFCRRDDTGAFYTPRIELNDMGSDPYFPDGTWCHSENGENYYCLQHHCLPENFKMTKIAIWKLGEDISIPGNAPPNLIPMNTNLLNYFSIDSDGKPLLTHLNPEDINVFNEQDWDSKDYIELPK